MSKLFSFLLSRYRVVLTIWIFALSMILFVNSTAAQVASGCGYSVVVHFGTEPFDISSKKRPIVVLDDMLFGAYRSDTGSLFAILPKTNTYVRLFDFTGTTIANANPDLTRAPDGYLYGTSLAGGSRKNGTLFRFDPRTGDCTVLASFGTPTAPGSSALAPLAVSSDGYLYGTTRGGIKSSGTLYRYDPQTNSFTTLVYFGKFGTGTEPLGAVIFAPDGLLYGTTSGGGNENGGTIFRCDPKTGIYTTLIHFGGKSTPGMYPHAGLTLGKDGNLYGTTHNGGKTEKYGTLFRYNPQTGAYTTLVRFRTGAATGTFPDSPLAIGKDGALYGTTSGGGTVNNAGSLFRYNLKTGVCRTLMGFGGLSGVYPFGSLFIRSDGSIYGQTVYGGKKNLGVLYRVMPPK